MGAATACPQLAGTRIIIVILLEPLSALFSLALLQGIQVVRRLGGASLHVSSPLGEECLGEVMGRVVSFGCCSLLPLLHWLRVRDNMLFIEDTSYGCLILGIVEGT